VLHDLHPDFYSTRFAVGYAHARGIEARGVQHHHAHIAAVCAEHGVRSPVLGIALDGVGLGTDGAAWGGELLRVEGASMQRVGHLAPIVLPGGDAAAREPWRAAAGVLVALGRGAEIAPRFGDHPAASIVTQMLARDVHCVRTTSAGRVFDAAAALLGIAELNRHESEAAMALEAAATGYVDAAPWQNGWRVKGGVLDLLPLFEHVASAGAARDGDTERARHAAAAFHATLARAVADWAAREARAQRLTVIALAGGCWLNRLLRDAVVTQLTCDGFTVLEAIAAPPNDGGIALGQAWVGLQQLLNT
jgi:hydrogenase maturation protein HypF